MLFNRRKFSAQDLLEFFIRKLTSRFELEINKLEVLSRVNFHITAINILRLFICSFQT